jgi:glycosyltransferase involved in cell wall biosynthesis
MNFLYIGEFDVFQNQSAAVIRVINNCKSLTYSGLNKAIIVGISADKRSGEFKSFKIFNIIKGTGLLKRAVSYLFRGFLFVSVISRLDYNYECIIYYGVSSRILLPLMIFSRLKNKKIIVDVVEWYDYSHVPFGRFGPLALDVHLSMTKLIPISDGIISISSYLEKYFRKKNCIVIRVPILIEQDNELDSGKTCLCLESGTRINLIYAGYAGKKESLGNLIQALRVLNNSKWIFVFHILGMTEKEVKWLYGDNLEQYIIAYGKVNRITVQQFLSQADFSVLFRPDKRFANAGFPTKFTESLSAGLPVIANLTSDLHLYLKDSYNGFIAENDTIESIIKVLKRISILDRNSIQALKLNAKASAIENFDYKLFSSKFDTFLDNI